MLQVDCILHSHTDNRVHAHYKYCIQQRPRNFLESGLKINEKNPVSILRQDTQNLLAKWSRCIVFSAV